MAERCQAYETVAQARRLSSPGRLHDLMIACDAVTPGNTAGAASAKMRCSHLNRRRSDTRTKTRISPPGHKEH